MVLKLSIKSIFARSAVLGALAVLPMVNAAAQETRIAFVSSERISRESAPVKAAEAKLEQEFARRAKDLEANGSRLKSLAEKLDKDAPVLSEAERNRRARELAELDKDLQRKQREFREDVAQRRNEELTGILERTKLVIKQIAEAKKYDVVLQDVVYFNPRIDITDEVLRALNGK
jgi:outer membrane protein